jgi:hypothetical protein
MPIQDIPFRPNIQTSFRIAPSEIPYDIRTGINGPNTRICPFTRFVRTISRLVWCSPNMNSYGSSARELLIFFDKINKENQYGA